MSHLLPNSHYLVLISSHSRPEAGLNQISQLENYFSDEEASALFVGTAFLGVSSVLTSPGKLKAKAFFTSSPVCVQTARELMLNYLETIIFKHLLLWMLWYLLLRNAQFPKFLVLFISEETLGNLGRNLQPIYFGLPLLPILDYSSVFLLRSYFDVYPLSLNSNPLS